MHRWPGVSQARPPDHISRNDRVSNLDEDRGEKRCRRLQAISVVDRHRQHPGDAAGKRHHSGPAGADLATESGGEVEAPVPRVSPRWLIRADHPSRDRRLQAQDHGQFEEHSSTSPHAARSTYQPESTG